MDLLPKGQAKAKIIAIDLGMSDRTFIRRISETGTSFNEILDELRQRLALKYVLETELNLAEIAFLLGYANQPAFNLAFKRWNGKPPSEMRAPGVRLTRKRK
jgi:AraC-like DNA-binding protein